MNRSLLAAALIALAVTACGKKEEVAAPSTAVAPVAAPADAAPAAVAAPAAAPVADAAAPAEKK